MTNQPVAPDVEGIVRGVLAKRQDRGLPKQARHFLYMPLMHSEAIADQRLALRLFAELADTKTLRFCRAHARMIERFGRFPHRNAVLGRNSTPEESAFLTHGPRFGQ